MSNNPKNPSFKNPMQKILIKKQEPPQKRLNLTRSTNIRYIDDNGESKECIVSFDDLEPGDFLGRGQFGTVKKMFHKPSNKTFAVKMINDDLMETADVKSSQIMDLEAPIKIGDGCPYLIKFYGALHAESYIWILTEVMDTSLDRFYIKMFALNIPIPESLISNIAFAVLSALDYMKKLKLMHRDIKPSNMLINSNGDIKVCDFGISGNTIDSVCKTFKGCQLYMPPEKIDPSLTGSGYTTKADIWSLGISIVEIATGAHPFKEAKGFLGLIQSIVSNESPKLDAETFSPEICSFVDKCLVKDAEKRSSCSDLLVEKFITDYNGKDKKIDVDLVKRVIDEVKKDVLEG